ncbi:SIMPL domain-containing protein [Lysobacter niabensis]|uniref:SIMPL domain-containing protein n=1 Tax=Agrilutibacter niabensis TaxID=380628 RepID=UPI00362014BD
MRALLLIGLLLSVPCWAGTALPDAPHVVTSGEGKVTAKPDLARVTISAQYRNANGATAKQSVDRSIEAFLKIAPGFGLTPDDITASDVSVSEDIDYDSRDRRVSNGFVANREVKFKLRDLERLGALLDAALAAGLTEIDNVSFESSHEDQLRLEARGKAIADAREKASGLATAFGGSLGPVYSINSVRSGVGDGYGATTLDRIEVTGSRIQRSAYLQPTVEYTENVSAVFELKR